MLTQDNRSVLIVHPNNIKVEILFGTRYRFEVCMGAHYLGVLIGDDDYKQEWLIGRMEIW